MAHTAVIQCYWVCYNSVLCDQEPHRPGCCTSWQTTPVRHGINESATLTGCDETNYLNRLYFCFFQAWCWICVSLCSSLCGWVSPSMKSWRCSIALTLDVISPPGIQNRQQSHVGMLAFLSATMWDHEWITVLSVYIALTEGNSFSLKGLLQRHTPKQKEEDI